LKDLKLVSTRNPEMSRLQSNLEQWAASVILAGLNDGVLLEAVSLSTGGTNAIEHKLNREPRGWIIVRKRANANVWDSQDANVFKTKSLALECSANVTVDLWVF
jgi:hypothetical protein